MNKEFNEGTEVSIPIRQRVRKKINEISFLDVVALVTIGLTIHTLSPVYLIATVSLIAIREAKDFFLKRDTENRMHKLEEDTNENLLALDEKTVALETKVLKLNQNDQTLRQDVTEIKNEVNRNTIKQKELFGQV